MKYACLLYLEDSAAGGAAPADDVRRRITALAERSGGAVLEPATAATSVRCRNGTVAVEAGPSDGPGLAAVLLIDAANLDAALATAARLTQAGVGVEVRPVRLLERRGPKRIARHNVVPLRAYE